MADVAAGCSDRSSRASCVLYVLGVVAKVRSGMATVRDFGRVSDCLRSDSVRGIRVEIDFIRASD
jgi:hypothetical protein